MSATLDGQVVLSHEEVSRGRDACAPIYRMGRRRWESAKLPRYARPNDKII